MDEKLKNMRHSGAHLLAAAIQDIYPDVKLAIGPAIDNGFYYDFDFGTTKISTEDFPKIEAKMKELKAKKLLFEKVEMSIVDAKKFLKDSKQSYSLSLLEDIETLGSTVKEEQKSENKKASDEIVTFYKSGDFINLCRGGHVKDFGEIGEFKITSVAGAYFRGSEKNPMLTRIYVACFSTKSELDDYFKKQEEAKKRDHRLLGEQLKLFFISDEVGSGLPLLMPNGEKLKYLLMQYMRKKQEQLGYKYVSSPIIANKKLYKRSGHIKYYSEDMFGFKDKEGSEFFIKPMNCPHHHMIYEKMVTSYRDLPLKLAEEGEIYRNELSGTLTGLIRVRGPITQNDAHIYVTKEQMKQEFVNVIKLFKEIYEELGVKNYWFRLSLPDFDNKSDKYGDGDDLEKWSSATVVIREALKEVDVPFVEGVGEAAFYGPKLDIQKENVNGKEDSIATSQIDILVPKRMNLTYTNSEGKEENPFIIHRAILGSFERFMAFLIEETGGHFPFWLSPVQVKILTIGEEVDKYVSKVKDILDSTNLEKPLKANSIRYEVDSKNESLSKKIREAEIEKVPIIIIIGPKDMENNTVSIRTKNVQKNINISELNEYLINY